MSFNVVPFNIDENEIYDESIEEQVFDALMDLEKGEEEDQEKEQEKPFYFPEQEEDDEAVRIFEFLMAEED